MRFHLTQISASVWRIMLNRKPVGQVVKKHNNDGYYGRMEMDGHKFEAAKPTAEAAFQELVAACNRVRLCGRNDPELARKALAAHNARILMEARKDYEAEKVVIDVVNDAMRDLKFDDELRGLVQKVFAPRKLRRKKVRI